MQRGHSDDHYRVAESNHRYEDKDFLLSSDENIKRPARDWSGGLTASLAHVKLETSIRLVRALGFFLLPSFVASRLVPSERARPSSATNVVSTLDGLRGLACLFVMNEHITYSISRVFLYPRGSYDHYYFIMLPFVRLCWSGFAMVGIFFAISGYVLSLKSLKQIQAKDMSGFNTTITSSIIRRGFRLYLPTVSAVMMTGLVTWMGAFAPAQRIWDSRPDLQYHEAPVPWLPSLSAQLWDAGAHAWVLFTIWAPTFDASAGVYDGHLWTIPVEFRNSMIIFLVLVGIARLKQTWRLASQVGIMTFAIYTGQKHVWLFMGGMFFADIDLLRKSWRSSTIPQAGNHALESFWAGIMVIGMYLSSISTLEPQNQHGYGHIQRMAGIIFWTFPPDQTVRSIGALLITWAAANSLWLKSVFTNPVSLYLGKISFALYIVHGQVIRSVQYVVLPDIYVSLGTTGPDNSTPGQSAMVWALCILILVPISIWTADVFWRAIDAPSVRFARWVVNKCTF